MKQIRLTPRMQPICWRLPAKVKKSGGSAKRERYMTKTDAMMPNIPRFDGKSSAQQLCCISARLRIPPTVSDNPPGRQLTNNKRIERAARAGEY